jgi:SAM-dependent methyltransferase
MRQNGGLQTAPPAVREGDEAAIVAELVAGDEILDCGCGTGRIGRAIRRPGRRVLGMELSPDAARAAREAYHRVVLGSITDPTTWNQFGDVAFDGILFVHVLEHLLDPVSALRTAIDRLRPGGVITVVLPNVANWRVRYSLLRGRWDYRDEGIMDRTHVRFYTYETASELLDAAGLSVRTALLYAAPAAGNPIRRTVVRAARRVDPLLFAHSLLFNCSVADGHP